MPSSNLPLDMLSMVATILASRAGCLKELQVAMVPSLIVLVLEDRAERVVQHSKIELFLNIKWSSSHNE